MKCPKCGSPRATYVVSRKKHWKGAGQYGSTKEQRKDNRIKCPDCGYEGELK